MPDAYEHILCSVEEGIMQITLNRPEKLNAYTATMGAELARAFDAADLDDAVRVVLVTGAGRGFCAGADMSAGAGAFDTTSAQGSVSFGDVSQGRQGRAGGSGMVGRDLRVPQTLHRRVQRRGGRRRPDADPADGHPHRRRHRQVRLCLRPAGPRARGRSAWFLPRLVGLPQALRWCLDRVACSPPRRR